MKNTLITPSWKEQRYGWVYFALQLLVLPTAVVLLLRLLPFPLTEAQQNVVFFVLNFFCVILVFFRYLKASLKRLGENLSACLGTAAMGFGLYYLGQILVGLAITRFYPNFQNVNDLSIQVMVQENFLPMAISTIFLVPVAEETLYRGLLFGSLSEKFHPGVLRHSCGRLCGGVPPGPFGPVLLPVSARRNLPGLGLSPQRHHLHVHAHPHGGKRHRYFGYEVILCPKLFSFPPISPI